MTLVVFILVQIASLIWFQAVGRLVVGNVTVYVAAYVIVLSTASVFAFLSGDRRCTLAALVLIANFGLAHWAWSLPHPLIFHAMINTATAAYFVFAGATMWEAVASLPFIVLIFGAMAAQFGFLPDSAGRPAVFVAISYPDINALAKYLAVIVLGIGAGDVGPRVRYTWPVVKPVYAAMGGSGGYWAFLGPKKRQEDIRSSETD